MKSVENSEISLQGENKSKNYFLFDCLLDTTWPYTFSFFSELSSINFLRPSFVTDVLVQSKCTRVEHLLKCGNPWLVTILQEEMSNCVKVLNELNWARPASLIFQHFDSLSLVNWLKYWAMYLRPTSVISVWLKSKLLRCFKRDFLSKSPGRKGHKII